MVIFHSYVKLPEGITARTFQLIQDYVGLVHWKKKSKNLGKPMNEPWGEAPPEAALGPRVIKCADISFLGKSRKMISAATDHPI